MNEEEFDARALWRSVIVQATADALSTNNDSESDYNRRTARSWFMSGSKDFCEVCEMAELDHGHVRRSIEEAITKQQLGTLGKLPRYHRATRKNYGDFCNRSRKRKGPKRYTMDGVTDTLSGWSGRLQIKRYHLANRLVKGMPFDDAVRDALVSQNAGLKQNQRTNKLLTV